MNEEEVVLDGAVRTLWCTRHECGPLRFTTWSSFGEHVTTRHPTQHAIQVHVTWEEMDGWTETRSTSDDTTPRMILDGDTTPL